MSVQRLGVPLTEAAVRDHLLGRRVYRRTEVLIAEGDEGHAVVAVDKAPDGDGLFRPVSEVHWISGPEATAFVRDPRTDTGNATQMARAAAASGASARVYVVEGRNEHVNLIVEPAPVPVRVVEVVPPHPPKLLDMAQRVLDYDEDLDPVALELVAVDLNEIAAEQQAPHWLLPCRSGGLQIAGPVDFLDSGPPQPPGGPGWTLLGCERSRQIHSELYGVDPAARIELCPRLRAERPAAPTLVKCCLRERGIETDGELVVVPWGATLEEVREALHRLVPGWREVPA
ncbi:MAG TPA: hypothetical protein VG474_15435 [Solirubrobacteraceae bacterium]|nr:hypothetical protein [Solirubrobacteraceae bacterium]